MAKLIKRSNFFKRKKKWEHFKLKVNRILLKVSLLLNIYFIFQLYFPKIVLKLTNNIRDIYLKVAPIVESLINQLPL